MIKGFSKLTKAEKQNLLLKHIKDASNNDLFDQLEIKNQLLKELIESFSENVVSTFPFPYGLVPNVLIDGKEYIIPFVTEESSVVAATASAAKYWYTRGGFHTQILGNIKSGHVHFKTKLEHNILSKFFKACKSELLVGVADIDQKMQKRGGGIQSIELINRTDALENYYQIEVDFITCNAMGANYMNSCLEGIAGTFEKQWYRSEESKQHELTIIMSILSNYSPENAVKVWVEADIDKLDDGKLGMSSEAFAQKFVQAVEIAEVDTSRAVTHNKGLYNGVDSVALATGNDWRAIEANGHAYASRKGHYQSLSHAEINNKTFRFELSLPLQVGTVGGVTALHPLTKLSLEILNKPEAEELMRITATAGLASNFAAVRALTTTGIQKGHMKMHLANILHSFEATENEKKLAQQHFSNSTISNSSVESFLQELRNK